MWIGESVSNNRCGEGYRLTDRTRQTCLRITNSRPLYPQRARSSRDAREVSGAFL